MSISGSPSMKPSKGGSASQNTRAGTSSRPGQASRYPIKTTAPSEPLTLGRDTPDSLHKRAPAPKGM
jgi:hypothetical protein